MFSSAEGWGKGEEAKGTSELSLPDTTCPVDYSPVPFHEPFTSPAQILWRALPELQICLCWLIVK